MFSAEMLSWILGARRFISIARICDARTPVTVTSCSASASNPALAVPDLAFLASGDDAVGPPCCAGSCTPAFSAGALVASDAMAEVVAAASNAMDMAIDRGCLRYTFDTAFPSRLLSFGSQMPCDARSAFMRHRHPPRKMASSRPSLVDPHDRLTIHPLPLIASIYSVD